MSARLFKNCSPLKEIAHKVLQLYHILLATRNFMLNPAGGHQRNSNWTTYLSISKTCIAETNAALACFQNGQPMHRCSIIWLR